MRKILFIAATHGDEPIGVNVLRKIEKDLPKDDFGYDWIIGNERAYEKNVRLTEADLNRSAPGNRASTIYEVRRAAEIVAIAKDYDAVIDIHGTATDCGVVTIVPYPTTENLDLAESTGLERNVVWFSESSVESGPLAQHVGVPAIELECGPKDDSDTEVSLEATVRNMIECNSDGTEIRSSRKQTFYEVYGKVLGDNDESLEDFQATTIKGETFFPFLSRNDYDSVTCYKMRTFRRKDTASR